MHDFVIASNRYWDQSDAVTLAAFALWRLNWIHPFVNGNGRTARAVCYYLVRVKMNLATDTWLFPLPYRIAQHRAEYVEALQRADRRFEGQEAGLPLQPVVNFLNSILFRNP